MSPPSPRWPSLTTSPTASSRTSGPSSNASLQTIQRRFLEKTGWVQKKLFNILWQVEIKGKDLFNIGVIPCIPSFVVLAIYVNKDFIARSTSFKHMFAEPLLEPHQPSFVWTIRVNFTSSVSPFRRFIRWRFQPQGHDSFQNFRMFRCPALWPPCWPSAMSSSLWSPSLETV